MLYQSNPCIKRKLQVWRGQKSIPLDGGKTTLKCAGRETTASQVSQYMAYNGNLRKSGSTFRHGTMFSRKQCLYEKEATVWRVQNCIPLVGAKTALTCAGRQTTLTNVSQYRADNGDLRKSGSTFTIVPRLQQKNAYIKRKLEVWRAFL